MTVSPNSPLGLAAAQIGLNERDQRTAIQEYLSNGGVNLDPATTAWCAAFVNATLAQTGQAGTGSNMARSFLDWGQGVDATAAQPGDVAVFPRGDPNGPYGHVGIIEAINPDGTITLIGGNQGDAVSRGSYRLSDALGVRRGADGGPAPRDRQDPAPKPGMSAVAAAYVNGRMTPEDEAIYEQGMRDGQFPAVRKRAAQAPSPEPDAFQPITSAMAGLRRFRFGGLPEGI